MKASTTGIEVMAKASSWTSGGGELGTERVPTRRGASRSESSLHQCPLTYVSARWLRLSRVVARSGRTVIITRCIAHEIATEKSTRPESAFPGGGVAVDGLAVENIERSIPGRGKEALCKCTGVANDARLARDGAAAGAAHTAIHVGRCRAGRR